MDGDNIFGPKEAWRTSFDFPNANILMFIAIIYINKHSRVINMELHIYEN